jgi:phage shock protein A
MGENIASRVGRLVAGSVNAIMDAAENASPEIVMQQSIREIDSAITEIRAEMGKAAVSQHMIQNRLASENQKHQTLSEQAAVALNEGRDDLIEAAIARQMDIEAQVPVMEKTLEKTTAHIKELEGYIAALQGKKREMQEELNLFKKQKLSSSSPSGAPQAKVDKAQAAFERVMGTHAPASGHADEAKLAELEALTRQNRIKERLEALKAQK